MNTTIPISLDHHEIVRMSPGSTIETCTTFLLEEEHFHEAAQKANGLFISLHATPGNSLLVEGEESCCPSRYQAADRKEFYINTPNIAQIIGWDIKEYDRLIHIPMIVLNLALSIAVSCKKGITLFDKTTLPLPIDWNQVITERLQKIWHDDVSPEKAQQLANLTRNHPPELIFPLQQFETTKITPCVKKLAIREALAAYYRENSDKTDEEFNEALANTSALVLLWSELQELLETRISIILDFSLDDFLFPQRTEAMVQTLAIKTGEMVANERLFLIAGVFHLEQKSDKVDPKEARLFSLKPLHDFIDTHPGIVILKPKCLQ